MRRETIDRTLVVLAIVAAILMSLDACVILIETGNMWLGFHVAVMTAVSIGFWWRQL